MWPSDSQVALHEKQKSCFCDQYSHMGLEAGTVLSLNKVWMLLHPEMHTETLLYTEEATYQFSAETLFSSLGQSLCQMDWRTVEMSHFILFSDKKKKKDVGCQRWKRPSVLLSVPLWRCISVHRMGDLHMCEITISTELYSMLGLYRHMLPSRQCLSWKVSKKIPGCILYVLQLQRSFVKTERVCLTGLPADQISRSPIYNMVHGELDKVDHRL